MSKRVADRILVLVGVGIGVLTYVWMLAVIPRFMPSTIRIRRTPPFSRFLNDIFSLDDRSNLPFFGVAIFLDLVSIPIMLDISMSLLTKLVSDEVQGFATGVRRFFAK